MYFKKVFHRNRQIHLRNCLYVVIIVIILELHPFHRRIIKRQTEKLKYQHNQHGAHRAEYHGSNIHAGFQCLIKEQKTEDKSAGEQQKKRRPNHRRRYHHKPKAE